MKTYFITTEEEYNAFLPKFDRKVFAFDTEVEHESFWRTGVMSQDKESLRWDTQRLVGVSVCDGKVAAYIDLLKYPYLGHVFHLFMDAELLFGHNIVFDAKAMYKAGCTGAILAPHWYDTMVASHLLDENGDKGLKALAKQFLGENETMTYIEARRKGYSHERFYQYAVNDAAWTWRLAQIMMHRIKEEGLAPLMNGIEMPFLKCVMEIEMNGMLVNQEKAERLRLELAETATQLEIKLLDILGAKYWLQTTFPDMKMVVKSDINLGSPNQIRQILFQDLGLPATEKTETGALSTGVKVLESLKGQHPFVDTLLEYRVVQKLRAAFFEPLSSFIDSDGRVRSHYNDTGTKTGRLSSSSPNMQQLPRPRKGFPNTRSCFVPQPGYVFISSDYSGQEIRVLAHLSQDDTMLEALRKGKDLHLTTANQFYELGIPDEELYETHPQFKVHKKTHDLIRTRAKTVTFGIAYGKSAFGFAKDFKVSEEEAQRLLDKYFNGFPRVKNAIDQCQRTVKQRGYVSSMFGRKRHFNPAPNGFYPKAAFREAFNFTIQSPSADMIRLAAIATRKLSQNNPKWDLRMVATIHDENVYEVREEFAEEAAAEIKKAFESAVSLSVPMVASVSIGSDFGALK